MNIHAVYAFFHLFRRKRMRQFAEYFRVTSETSILDVGGTSHNWQYIEVKP